MRYSGLKSIKTKKNGRKMKKSGFRDAVFSGTLRYIGKSNSKKRTEQ